MKSDVSTLNDLTSKDVRYVVPRYQRPYVWTEEKHWEPLWGDIETAVERLDAGEPRDHFLGAIVLKGTTQIPGKPLEFEVIDGQQRLTTVQIILAAAADVAFEAGAEKVGRLFGRMVLNDPDMTEGEERFKLSPTAWDREAFFLIARDGGPPPDAEDDPENTIQEGYDFFRKAISEATIGDGSNPGLVAARLESLRAALASVFKVVTIVLEGNDEAQVIFETLNARGTPLLALDLVKNAIFLEAGLGSVEIEELHDRVWEPELGLPYWREEIRQGRLTRTRAELFLIHWMTMKLALRGDLKGPIRNDRVFQTFSTDILKDPNSPGPAALVGELVSHARTMRELDNLDASTPEGRFLRVTEFLDTSVFFPLVLFSFVDPDVTPDSRREILGILESFQIRRSLLGRHSKAYNRLVIRLLTHIGRSDNPPAATVLDFFQNSDASSGDWPTDREIRGRLVENPIYGWVGRGKLVGILAEIERDLRSDGRTEESFDPREKLSLEHVMPQTWKTNWPLADDDPEATKARNELVQTIGNLTLVTGRLNSSLSNENWPKKQARFQQRSVLLLNREISENENWGDQSIRHRGELIADRILRLWPRPTSDKGTRDDEVRYLDQHSGGEMSAAEIIEAVGAATPRFRSLAGELSGRPDEYILFGEVETRLKWNPGTLPSVIAGFTRTNEQLEGRRPFDTARDQNENWWIRMNRATAESVDDILLVEPPAAAVEIDEQNTGI